MSMRLIPDVEDTAVLCRRAAALQDQVGEVDRTQIGGIENRMFRQNSIGIGGDRCHIRSRQIVQCLAVGFRIGKERVFQCVFHADGDPALIGAVVFQRTVDGQTFLSQPVQCPQICIQRDHIVICPIDRIRETDRFSG